MKTLLTLFVLFFSSTVVAERINLLLEIKVNELSIYKDENGFERVKLNYDLTNNYDKLIKLVDHKLITNDLLGEIITKFYLEQDIYLSPNTQKNFIKDSDVYVLGYTPSRLKKIRFEDFVFEYEVESIVFEDNVILKIDSEN